MTAMDNKTTLEEVQIRHEEMDEWPEAIRAMPSLEAAHDDRAFLLSMIAELEARLEHGQASEYLLEENIKQNTLLCKLEARIEAAKNCHRFHNAIQGDVVLAIDLDKALESP